MAQLTVHPELAYLLQFLQRAHLLRESDLFQLTEGDFAADAAVDSNGVDAHCKRMADGDAPMANEPDRFPVPSSIHTCPAEA